jgi:ABC-2 type transport system permease protein
MRYWIVVFRHELRHMFVRKSYLFITFGIPILALLAFYGYRLYQHLSADEEETPAIAEVNKGSQAVGYVDLTPQGLFPAPDSYPPVKCEPSAQELALLNFDETVDRTRSAVIKRISSPYCLRELITRYGTEEEGKAALEAGDISALYVIEPDFVESGKVSVYVSGLNLQAADTQNLMEDYLVRSLLVSVDVPDYESLYLRLRTPAVVVDHRLSETGAVEESREDQEFLLVYAFGLLLMFSVFWGGGYMMASAVAEKESRIVEVMLTTVRPMALLLGKILAAGLLALLQMITLAGTLLFIGSQLGDVFEALGDIEVSTRAIVTLAVYFLLGFLFFGGLMAAIGAMSTSLREAQNFVTIVTLPAAIPFFFLTIFAEEPNGTLAVILSLIPFTAPLAMVMRQAVVTVPTFQLVLGIALQMVAVAGAVWLAGRMFRVNMLLMGHMPRLRDIPKLVRG